MDVQHMLDNAATASQHAPIVDDEVVVGAILRSIHQWLESDENGDIDFLKFSLKSHRSFNL